MNAPTTMDLMRIAGSAQFRPMTAHDFMAFSGAPAGAQIADQHPDVLVVFTPAGIGEYADDYFEFHGATEDGEPWCVALNPRRLI